MTSETAANKERKSIRLEKAEVTLLKKYVSGFNTVVEAAQEIGIHRNVLDRVQLAGSGSPFTIDKIRAALYSAKVATA